MSDQALQEQLTHLPKEMEPKRDLWTGIEKAIAHTPQQQSEHAGQKSKVVPMAWAASLVAAVLLTWFSFTPQGDVNSNGMNLVKVMKQEFEQQRQLVLTSYGQPNLGSLPQEMKDQLTELASARQAIEKALKNDPNNSELFNLLRWTQKQEIDLLKQLYSPQWQTI